MKKFTSFFPIFSVRDYVAAHQGHRPGRQERQAEDQVPTRGRPTRGQTGNQGF